MSSKLLHPPNTIQRRNVRGICDCIATTHRANKVGDVSKRYAADIRTFRFSAYR